MKISDAIEALQKYGEPELVTLINAINQHGATWTGPKSIAIDAPRPAASTGVHCRRVSVSVPSGWKLSCQARIQ